MKKVIFVLVIFLVSFISANCDSGQIDINSASLEELDLLYGIGPAKAQAIIDSRPYTTIDDLINADGIGDVTLENIKSQGLACVSEIKEEIIEEDLNIQEESDSSIISEKNYKKESIDEKLNRLNSEIVKKDLRIEKETIILNPQNIKSEDDKEKLSKNKYIIYGLIGFCFLLSILFIIEKHKYRKNEFRK